MADIDIVPKRRSGNLWLWIIIAIIVVAALWFALGRSGRTSRVGSLDGGAPAATAQLAVPGVGEMGG
jgi:hypothetical protein